jgi:hypothetical protein
MEPRYQQFLKPLEILNRADQCPDAIVDKELLKLCLVLCYCPRLADFGGAKKEEEKTLELLKSLFLGVTEPLQSDVTIKGEVYSQKHELASITVNSLVFLIDHECYKEEEINDIVNGYCTTRKMIIFPNKLELIQYTIGSLFHHSRQNQTKWGDKDSSPMYEAYIEHLSRNDDKL